MEGDERSLNPKRALVINDMKFEHENNNLHQIRIFQDVEVIKATFRFHLYSYLYVRESSTPFRTPKVSFKDLSKIDFLEY